MSMTEESVRHAMGSAVPGGVPFGGQQQGGAPPPAGAPFGGQQGPQAPSPPQQSTTPARSEDRRGVADTPSAPVRHSAMPANASDAPAPSRDDELKSSIDGWQGAKNLDYWKLKAESADRAAKRSRGIDPDTRRPIGQGAAAPATAASTRPTGEGNDRPGNSSSGGASREGIGDSGSTTQGGYASDQAAGDTSYGSGPSDYSDSWT